eukprot:jgi/Bigna1/144492/aug1.88_g19200
MCIDLVEKRPNGLFPMLEDEGNMPGGSEQGYVQKLRAAHKRHPNYVPARAAAELKFTVKHYAKPVVYSVDGFIAKNFNKFEDTVVKLFVNSGLSLLSTIFEPLPPKTPGKSAPGGGVSATSPLSSSSTTPRAAAAAVRERKTSFAKSNLKKATKANNACICSTLGCLPTKSSILNETSAMNLLCRVLHGGCDEEIAKVFFFYCCCCSCSTP